MDYLCSIIHNQNNIMSHILDYKSIVIENFKEAVRQYEIRKGWNDEANEYLIRAQTYYGLLIQFGMNLSELNEIAEQVQADEQRKKEEDDQYRMQEAIFEWECGGYED